MPTPLQDLCYLRWELDHLENSLGELADALADMELQNLPPLVDLQTNLALFAQRFTIVAEALTNRSFGQEFVELQARKSGFLTPSNSAPP